MVKARGLSETTKYILCKYIFYVLVPVVFVRKYAIYHFFSLFCATFPMFLLNHTQKGKKAKLKMHIQ